MKFAKGSHALILFMSLLLIISGILFIVFQSFSPFFMSVFLFFCIIEGFLFIFFRDPKRKIGKGVVAAADGIIRDVSLITDKDIGEAYLFSTFMNIYHVHVNRMPLDGTFDRIIHIPGGHLPAFTKESERNERMITLMTTEIGVIKIIQIAGSIARRIQHYGTLGQNMKKGERMGIIKLGSRVDLIIPKQSVSLIHVKKGDSVRAGTTSICTRKS